MITNGGANANICSIFNFPLNVPYNASGCELFSQSALYIAPWSDKKL